jgi:glycosyltransferase involved in cell wall biosynthesis
MKLFFDARFIRTDFHDSMSRCSTELGTALATITPVTFIICDKAQLKLLPDHAEYVMLHAPTSPLEPFSSLLLNKYHPDVVFTPMQTLGTGGRNFKVILMLHDLIYYHYRTPPQFFNPLIRLGWRAYHLSYVPQRITLNSADMVATVSETSKKEILSAKLTKRPMVIIPNAPRLLETFLKKPVSVTKAPKNLVYMGTFMGYKNVESLIAAMEFLPGRTLHLLSRITPQRHAELLRQVPKDADIVFHSGVSDEKYAELLADDAIFVTASRYEGFCLPLAEALALGIPAVVSDLPVLHEVAGEGALYANPNDPKEFADRILKLDDAKTLKKLVTAGKKHIARYNWKKSAEILRDTAEKLSLKKSS